MDAITYHQIDTSTNPGTIAQLHGENGEVGLSMLVDCAPEGGIWREPQPAKESSEWPLLWVCLAPIAAVFGGLIAVAYSTPY